MKRGLLPPAAVLVAAFALFGCTMFGSGDGGQGPASEPPAGETAAAPTATPVPAPTDTPAAPAPPEDDSVQAADPSDPQLVAQGETLYQQHCASCHGVDLEGQPNWRRRDENGLFPAPPHDASGHTWHHPDQMLFDITKFGTTAFVGGGYKSNMIGFEEQLSDAEIWAVLSFIKSRWPPRIRAAQPGN